MKVSPVEWHVEIDESRAVTIRGNPDGTLFQIKKDGLVLAKSGEWIYEVPPSRRDTRYLQRICFQSLSAAVDHIEEHLDAN